MTAEILSQVRVLLAAGAGFLVGKGYMDSAIAEASVGLVILLIPAFWAWWAKRPTSFEAISVAEKVADSDDVPHIINTNIPR